MSADDDVTAWLRREAEFAAIVAEALSHDNAALRANGNGAAGDPPAPDRRVRPVDPDAAALLWDRYVAFRAGAGVADVQRDDWQSHPLVSAHFAARCGAPVVEWMARRLVPDAPFVAVGCGTGEFEAGLAARVGASEVHLVDTSAAARDTARRRVADALPDAEVTVHVDFDTVATQVNDANVCFHHSLHHFADVATTLATAARIVGDGGRLVAFEYVGPPRFAFGPDDVRPALTLHRMLDPALRSAPGVLPLPDHVDVAAADPSEAPASDTIPAAIARRFGDVERVALGGGFAYPLWYGLDHDVLFDTERGTDLVRLVLDIDAALADSGRQRSHFDVYCARVPRSTVSGAEPAPIGTGSADLVEARAEIELLRALLRTSEDARHAAEAVAAGDVAPLVERLVRERDAAAARVDELERSTSWRITAPLRKLRGGQPGG